MNILVTGSNGQLGTTIRKLSGDYQDDRFFFTDIDELDITREQAVSDFVTENAIGCIINAAAYTAVDKAESEPEKADMINGNAVSILARAAKDHHALLVHISTDYVFSGRHYQPLKEDEKAEPVSAYARSKLLGEQRIMQINPAAVIIRTSWLYSEYGQNFMKSMIKYGREREQLNVVCDQIGTPTYAGDLAGIILALLPQWAKLEVPEIYHYSNEGVASWYDFALAIHEIAGINCRVNPIETKDYPLPAKRPFYSIMSKEKISSLHNITIPHWRESLKVCIRNLGEHAGAKG
ncbi:MAG: dTDP-4-dehydrorhamnose reductase [Bacteroidales bacterium]